MAAAAAANCDDPRGVEGCEEPAVAGSSGAQPCGLSYSAALMCMTR